MRNYQQKRNDVVTPLEQLQQLLVPQEIFAWEEEIEKIQQNLARIEHKINDREELKRSPLWEEMLSKQAEEVKGLKKTIAMLVEARIKEKCQRLKREMSEAIAPAIAKAMEGRRREKKEELETVITPIVSRAISEYIKESPLEIAQAIAPEIASAVQEQNRLDRDAMVKALSPLIDEMIQNKILQDKESMSAAIAPVISPAITQQIQEAPQEVASAIAPEIAAAVEKQIKLERTAMVDALYPIVGSTISKYIGETIRDINRKIENTLTFKGIERKVRAKLQGVSEAELLLAEEISFSTRAIFLIHKASGIVISEVQQPDGPRLESDLVAGMLTAIRSFAGEYLAQSGQGTELDAINYDGNDKIILEVAGSCYLAVVIEGEPSKQFIQKMRQTFSEIILEHGKAIEIFKGKQETIPREVHEKLQELVTLEESKTRQKPPRGLLAISLALAALIALPWGIHQYRYGVDRHLEAKVADALAAAPSLSVYRLDVEVDGGNMKLTGRVPSEDLRRQAEAIARAAAPTLELENQLFAVEVPPDAKQTAAELHRVTLLLNQIDGIAITTNYADGQVTVTGVVANRTEGQKIVQALQQIPGVKSAILDLSLPPKR